MLREKLIKVDVDLIAEVGHIDVPMGDVLALQPGDVIRLYNVRVGDAFSLNVGNIPKFLCKPGVIGRKMAVQITQKLAEIDAGEIEELTTRTEELL